MKMMKVMMLKVMLSNLMTTIHLIPSMIIIVTAARSHNISIKENMDYLEIPLNSAIWYLQSEKEKKVLINPIKYPWDLHYVIQKVLQDEVTHVSISPNASISKTTVFDGPCIIEDDVTIDDFCKIKGPTYISKGSFIGMTRLSETACWVIKHG